MNIIVDSREQKPYLYEKSIVKKLDQGDYSVEGYEDEVAVERKGLNDAIGSVIQGRTRFEKEWVRAKKLKRFFIVIEGDQDAIMDGVKRLGYMNITKDNFIRRNIKSVINTYIHWCVQYNVPVFFCKNRKEAKSMTYELLRAYVKYDKRGVMK